MKQFITLKHESWKRFSFEQYSEILYSLGPFGATPERVGSGAYDMLDYGKRSNEETYELFNSGEHESALIMERKKAPKLNALLSFENLNLLERKSSPSLCSMKIAYATLQRKKMIDDFLNSFISRHMHTDAEISYLSLGNGTIKVFSSETIPKILDFYMQTSICYGASIHWLTIFGREYVSFLGGVEFIQGCPAIVQELSNGDVMLQMSEHIEDIYKPDYQSRRDEIADYLDPDEDKIFRMRWVHENWKRPSLKTPWRNHSDKSMMVPKP